MAPHQRAVLLPGGWASTSGPRGGASQFKLNCSSCPGPDCTPVVDMSCTSDPFSCANLNISSSGPNPGNLVDTMTPFSNRNDLAKCSGEAGLARCPDKRCTAEAKPREKTLTRACICLLLTTDPEHQSGLVYEVEQVLTQLGGRPCWQLDQYDTFNVKNALAYYNWAVADPRVVAINIWPWSTWLPPTSYPGTNVGLKALPKASTQWADIGRAIKKGQQSSRHLSDSEE